MSDDTNTSETPPTPRTVKVRVAVAVDPEGRWAAYGHHECAEDSPGDMLGEVDMMLGEDGARFWLTAELPVPTVAEVVAAVERASQGRED